MGAEDPYVVLEREVAQLRLRLAASETARLAAERNLAGVQTDLDAMTPALHDLELLEEDIREHLPTYQVGEGDDTEEANARETIEYAGAEIKRLQGEVAKTLRKLQPMSEAPTTGPVREILAATRNRAGCHGWLIVHYADGGGEEQPRYRGWYYWTGYDFREIGEGDLIGWLPLPDSYKAKVG